MAFRRKKISYKKSKKMFRKNIKKNTRNKTFTSNRPMRGGYRL